MPIKDRDNKTDQKEDAWFGIYWRPAAAVIYLLICVFDFIVVPTYMGLGGEPLKEIILAIKDLPQESQSVVLNHKLASWEPLTLKGGGLFHVAFGAILGATVWTRGQERIHDGRWQNYYDEPPRVRHHEQLTYPPHEEFGEVNTQMEPISGGRVDNPERN